MAPSVSIFYCTQQNKTKQKVCRSENIFSSKFYKYKKNFWDSFLKLWASINLPWRHVRPSIKFGPNRFSRFDVYWIQTDRLITSKVYMYRLLGRLFRSKFFKNRSFNKPSLGSHEVQKKCGPNWLSRFDVYWIETDTQWKV